MISADSMENYPGLRNGFKFENGPISVFSNQSQGKGFKFNGSSPPCDQSNHSDSPCDSGVTTSNNGDHTESTKYSNPILRYIREILMDEEGDLERKPCMLQDCLKLQAAEKSFFDVLGSGGHDPDDDNNNNNNSGGTTSSESNSCSYSTDNSSSYESDWVNCGADFESSFLHRSLVESKDNACEVFGVIPNNQFRDLHGSGHFQTGTLNNIFQSLSIPPKTEAYRGTRDNNFHLLWESNNFSSRET